jgi:hypothetical protein
MDIIVEYDGYEIFPVPAGRSFVITDLSGYSFPDPG